MTKASKPRKKSEKQLLVEALLRDAKGCNWGLEMKMVGHLLKRIPDPKFWFDFGATHKYPTLIHLLSDVQATNIVVQAHIAYTRKNLNLEKVSNPAPLSLEKVGSDIIVEQQKPKTIKDFIQGI
jgi:hypothetical protein